MSSYLGMIGNFVAGAGVLIQMEQDRQIALSNAEAARQDARLAVLAASVRSEEIFRDAASFKGTQAAVAAANGVVSTKGSALGLIVKTAGAAERASQREKFAGEVEAAKFITEANYYKREADNIQIRGAVQALATSLSGVTFDRGSAAAGPRQSAGRSAFQPGDYRAPVNNDVSGFAANSGGTASDGGSGNFGGDLL